MQSLGKYQLVAEIARGGMGIVYLAVANGPAGFSKLFVIKELKPELVVNGDFFDMFLEEARLAARLSHPNIVTTYEVGSDGQRPFIVMDYLEGESLARVVRKKSERFTLGMQLHVLCHVLDALEHAHHLTNFDDTIASIIHRDVSPQNVFITFDGQVKLVDFGIAKASDTVLETQAGTFKGKPGYMAPEQLGGDVDARADVFSVGVMLWEACAGQRMFKKQTQLEILTALIKGDIPRLGDVKPETPSELQRICDRATAKDPEERYGSASELRAAIEAYRQTTDERPTSREIGAVVSALFEDQRRERRQIIESCITSAKNGAPTVKLPSLAPPAMDNTPPRPPQHTLPFVAHTSPYHPPPPSHGAPANYANHASGGLESGSGRTPDVVVLPSEQSPSRRGLLVVLLLLAIVSASVLATVLIIRGADGPRDRSVVAATSPPPPAVTTPLPAASATPPPADSVEQEAAHAARVAASASAAAAARPRIIYMPAPTIPAKTPTPSGGAGGSDKPGGAAPTKPDCNPPFYFDGPKKVFKPGCL